ncbi:sialidase family protein [Algoriphagus sp.]|uniref:sialidase family protein n=1 Tax=Algoriphagus sp. TaxID=1872435 RepID=UPI003919ACB9
MIHTQNSLILTGLLLTLSFSCSAPKSENQMSTVPEITLEEDVRGMIFDSHPGFAQAHASTIEALGNGNYLVAWFGGSFEKHDDVGIWMAKGDESNWTEPQVVAKVRNDPHWNPVLHRTEEGKIYLFFKVGKEIDHWETWIQSSDDNGTTWTTPTELVPGDKGGRGPVRNHLTTLSDGTWLAPASHELNKVWNAFVDRSTDQGKTWERTQYFAINREIIPGEGIIQPTAWESGQGQVHLLLRSSAGKIARVDSRDGGKIWSPVYLTDLPNNNSAIEVAHLGGEKIALLYNPVEGNWGDRNIIELAVSLDNGKNWPIRHTVEETPDPDGEFSYPSMILDGDHLVFTYTWNRKKVAFGKVKIKGLS